MDKIMDPSSTLNEQLVRMALTVIRPSVFKLFEVEKPQLVWGPKYVAIVVQHPHVQEMTEEIFAVERWNKKWGVKEDFFAIARWKARVAVNMGMSTAELVHLKPWEHPNLNYPYAGGVCDGKLGVGASGLTGYADEIIANLALDTIKGLSRQKMKDLLASKP